MRRLQALTRHPLAGSTLRYGIAGVIVGIVFIGVPLALNGGLGVPIEVAIPIGYVMAISLHFTLQRYFVFRHIEQFALSVRQQMGRYVMMGSVQYPATAVLTALLPGVLGLSQRVTYVIVALVISIGVFLVLRWRVFHAHDGGAAAGQF